MKISSAAVVLVCAISAPFVAGCDGEDACEPGFEREAGACVDVRARFAGAWAVSDTCSASGPSEYEVTITLDPAAADGLLISDFWGVFLAPVRASLSADELTIDRQEPDADAYFVQGSGVVQDEPGSLSFDYRVSDENDPTAIVTDRCQSTWTKQ